MASNTDDTFAQYKTYAGIAIGGVLLASILDACTAPSEEEIAEAKAAKEAVVEARRAAVENPGAEAEEKIKPIEKLAVVEKAPAPGPARDGATVYQSACMACHAAGVMEAPKLEAGAWDTRVHKGLDGLTTSAINGINNMPARGGNPAVTDEEMKNAVAYMLTESGYDPDALGEAAAEEKTATIDPAVMEEIKAAAAEAKASAEAAQASAAEAMTSAEAAQASAAEAMTSAEAAKTTVAGATAAVAAAVATADSGTEAETTKPIETATTEAAPAAVAQTSGTGSVGKQVYDTTCFTCHGVGIFGSPMITDTAAWNERIGKGIEALYASAINGNGTNTKPAKGGHPDLSEAQVKAAVNYMLDTAGVDISADAGNMAEQTTEEAPAAEEKAAEAETTVATQENAEEATTEEKTEAAQAEAQPETDASAEKAETQKAQPAAAETSGETETTDAEQSEQSTTSEAKQEAAAEPSWANIDGEKVYRGICFSCHDMGVAQAPVLGKATAWEARIAAGMETLYNNSINGKGIMPARGGNPSLSDDEIKAAVDWMVEQIQ